MGLPKWPLLREEILFLRFTITLCATAAIVGLAGTRTAAAQSDQQTASTGNGLEEIVVTARKREERVQTVPLAITAFSQADLQKDHVQQLRDLAQNVPSFSISLTSSDPNSLYSGQVRLRGLAGSVIYFADVPVSNTDYSTTTGLTHGLSPGFYYDVDSVEIDKGAQGTLFGRPSIGGLIAIQPKRPTNDFEGYIQTTFGNYGDKENEFALNVPIVDDKLLVRISGQMQQRDGYTKDEQTGAELDNRNYYAWRVGVTFRPTDDFENYLVYDGYWQDSDGTSDVLLKVNPNFVLVPKASSTSPALGFLSAFGLGNAPLTLGRGPSLGGLATNFNGTIAAAQAAGAFSIFPNISQALAQQQALGVREVAGRYSSGIGKDYFYGFTDIARWDINDDLTFKNIAAARVTKQLGVDDFTNTGLGALTIGYPSTNGGVTPGNNIGWNDDSVQYTDELQIQGKALNDKLNWVAGGFLLFDHPLGYNTEPTTAFNTTTWDHFHEEDRSQAIFAHGIYDLSDYVDGLRFTAGYRFTWDYDSLGEQSTNPVDMVTRNAAGKATDCNIAGSDNNCFKQVDSYFNSYGWNVGLDEQLTSDTLIYVRSGNAYRPGGTNLAVPAPFNRFQPEHVTDVELGVKTDWEFDGVRARTNADIFYTFYKNIQVAEVVSVPSAVTGQPPSAQSVTANAAAANMQGAEIEQTFNLPFGLDISGHGSYFNAKYSQFPAEFGGGTPGFQYVPRFSFAITPTYHLPVDEALGEMSVGITWSWYGHQSVSPIPTETINNMPHYENFDIRADWTNMFSQPVDLGFFMTNVTNNVHIVGIIPVLTSAGFTSAAYDAPRMFGFSLKYRFEPSKAEAAAAGPAYVPPPAAAPSVPHSYLVFFDFNKSDLTPQAVGIVDQAAKNAGPAKVTQLTVTGHTDTVGSDAYNLRLSRRRAESVAAQLEKDGIPSSEIQIVAKGKRDPLVPTADGVKEPQNRRVQIVYDGGAPAS
jgi:iron complex outermembrane receptor protein